MERRASGLLDTALAALARQFVDGALRASTFETKRHLAKLDDAVDAQASLRENLQHAQDRYRRQYEAPRLKALQASAAFEAQAAALQAAYETALKSKATAEAEAARYTWLVFCANRRPSGRGQVPPVFSAAAFCC